MSKMINIGGRIHSTEVGNVTTGANEVLDDTKGKKQNVINADVDAELLRLDQSKQNNLTFDNTPTENSTNPVTSGGVYAANITLHELIEAILVLIPSAASALNQLADKAFVNSSVSTATATFRGTYNVVTDLELAYDATHEQIATKLGQVIATADNNDYAFVQVPVSATSTDIRRTERYKFNGTVWGYEYDLNTSGFTAAQWEAINSGITALLVSKLTNLPTAEVLATMFNAKQNVLTFDAAPTALSTNPVYSGGVYAAIKAITDLIPAEATNLNQLADKAYVLAQILAATPAFKGQFTSLVDLQAVSSPKAGDLGIVRTKDNDGKDVFTVYQYLNDQWNVYFSLSYHPQTKPATTGTTGDYPYNGMGRVEFPMNMVGGVNTLTQSMMPTATGGNTVYVIKYDFTLGENITIPANCVLEFDGGSVSGAYTITGNDTRIEAGFVQLFNTNVLFAGTWNVPKLYPEWFGGSKSNTYSQNHAIVEHTISAMNSMGGGTVYIGHDIKHGAKRNTAYNIVVTNDIIIEDESEYTTYENSQGEPHDGVSRDGAQKRIYFLTKGDVYNGQHDGNGFWINGEWHPYISINSTSLPEKATERFATIMFCTNGTGTWLIGQGGKGITRQPGDTTDYDLDMTDFYISRWLGNFGTRTLNISRRTGRYTFNGGDDYSHTFVFSNDRTNDAGNISVKYTTDSGNVQFILNSGNITRIIEMTSTGLIRITNNGATSNVVQINSNGSVTIDSYLSTKLLNLNDNGQSRSIGIKSNGSININNPGNTSEVLHIDPNGRITASFFGGAEVPYMPVVSGQTANRPTSNVPVGTQYFDTTLGKPIWWNGSAWVDATGATV